MDSDNMPKPIAMRWTGTTSRGVRLQCGHLAPRDGLRALGARLRRSDRNYRSLALFDRQGLPAAARLSRPPSERAVGSESTDLVSRSEPTTDPADKPGASRAGRGIAAGHWNTGRAWRP